MLYKISIEFQYVPPILRLEILRSHNQNLRFHKVLHSMVSQDMILDMILVLEQDFAFYSTSGTQ